ncbi:MAG: phospho-N-acetylmuramoyl-pentapeptide-transferase [Defluviitaleaceae bacterium]|nr:phospho-N-acetylmuramoyl-pentapeptide-transferase [Defluviitaleaceae bacterium]
MNDLVSAIIALLIAFLVNVILLPFVIPILRKIKFGQNVRQDGPNSHLKKTGTPTMGGIVILISFVAGSLIFLRDNTQAIVIVLVTLSFGVIGFIDDYIKVVKKRSLGLRGKQKIVLQFIVSAGFVAYLVMNNEANNYSSVYIPFVNDYALDLGIFFIPLMLFGILGITNAVNLTDGLDGLATGVTALVVTFFTLAAWALSSTILPVTGAAVGSLVGFLLFNKYPAKVFMGDTGSLALGGLVVSVAIVLRMPIFLVIVGLIYVLEALSVTIQVFYFKITGGKRFFKMAPLHHHYELKGWSETKVVKVFYLVTAILCLVGFVGAQNMF